MSQSRFFSYPNFTIFFLSCRPKDITSTTKNLYGTYQLLRKKGSNELPQTTLFRHDLYTLTNLSTIMHRRVCSFATQLLLPTVEKRQDWHFHQLPKTRVEIIWNCYNSNNMSLRTAYSSNYSKIDEFIHSTPMR